MPLILSSRDHRELKAFIRSTVHELSQRDSFRARRDGGGIRDSIQLLIAGDEIEPATRAGDVWTPGVGEARTFVYSTSSGAKYTKAAATRGTVTVHNLHLGMWVWSDVMFSAFRDPRSGVFIADNLSQDAVVKGRANGGITAGSTSGQVHVYRGLSVERTVTNVHHDWMEGAADIATGTDLIMKYFIEESAWRIIEAECP